MLLMASFFIASFLGCCCLLALYAVWETENAKADPLDERYSRERCEYLRTLARRDGRYWE